MQVLFDFPSFVPMLQGFLRLVIHFTEGMFRIPYSLSDYVQRFGHNISSFVVVERGVKDAIGLWPRRALPTCLRLASAASSDSNIQTQDLCVHSKIFT